MEPNNFEIIVVGGGVCGAISAFLLSKEGHKVLLLEAGTGKTDRIAFAGKYATAVVKHPGSPYSAAGPGHIVGPDNDPGYYLQQTKTKLASTFLRLQGGSTWHFLGNVPRFIPSDFKLKKLYGVADDWPIDYKDLEEYYGKAETEMGVSGDHEQWNHYLGAYRSDKYPMEKIWQTYGDQIFLRKVDGKIIDGKVVKIMSTPQARNSTAFDGRPACAGNSTCVPICPIQAKYDATVHLKKAVDKGCVIKTDCVVKKLTKDGAGNIVSLIYIDIQSKNEIEINTQNKIVIVAAHAIETPRLLLNSELATKSGQVGKNLMDHLQGYCVATSSSPVYPFRGPITTSGVDVFRDGDSRKNYAAFRLSIGNDGWGRVGSPLSTLWDKLNQGYFGEELANKVRDEIVAMVRISFSTEMLPQSYNSVSIIPNEKDELGIPKPVINFQFDDYNKRAMLNAFKISSEIMELAGCNVVVKKSQYETYSGAGHIMGTTRMGTDESNSVVNSFGKCHEHPNLYIVGPSVFVTSGTANPTLTAVALSIRTAEKIDHYLKAQK